MKSGRMGGRWLTWAIFVTLGVAGCARDPEPEQTVISRHPVSRQTLDFFLEALKAQDYERAGSFFGGPYETLLADSLVSAVVDSAALAAEEAARRDPTLEVDSTDTAEEPDLSIYAGIMLHRYYAPRGGCAVDYRIIETRLLDPINISARVEFREWGHDSVAKEFRVSFDGSGYRVLGLPPTRMSFIEGKRSGSR